MSDDLTMNVQPIVDGVSAALASLQEAMQPMVEAMQTMAQPQPMRDAQACRDAARKYHLDVAQRNKCRLERQENALVATWDGEELTRYKTNE